MRLNIIILYFLSAMHAAWADEIDLYIGKYNIHATIANTPQSRERGLMHTTQLCGNCGMLFVFPQSGKYKFWMKDTMLPLSIAFIAADGSILNIEEMQADSSNTHSAAGDALYVLEMNKDWYAKRAIKPRHRVEGLQNAPQGL